MIRSINFDKIVIVSLGLVDLVFVLGKVVRCSGLRLFVGIADLGNGGRNDVGNF